MPQRKKITKEEKIKILELYKQKRYTFSEIAEIVGRSRAGVQKVVYRYLGPERKAYRPWTREEDERLEELYMAGVPTNKIAVELDRSADAIRKRVRVLSRSWKEPTRTSVEDAIEEARRRGNEELADAMQKELERMRRVRKHAR